MDINIMLLPETDSVFLLNGKFFEGDRFTSSPDNVVYITVLPLDAVFMPYTVKLIGHKAVTNTALTRECKISEREYALKLGKRYGFVYFEGHKNEPDDICDKFFYFVKGKHFNFATEMLTKSLTEQISEDELSAFFNEYVDIVKVKDSYFAVDKDGVGHLCVFTFKDGKIDNITVD